MAGASEPTASPFTEEDSDFQLSALVQSFPCIWDTEHPQYRSTNSRDEAWEQIALDMEDGRPADEYKLKWRHLRDKYSKFLRECSDPNKTPSYFYLAKAMEFLKPYYVSQNGHNGHFTQKTESSETGRFISVDARNEDAMFLLSVLPNMRQMSAERKKLFKVCLLQACDQILG